VRTATQAPYATYASDKAPIFADPQIQADASEAALFCGNISLGNELRHNFPETFIGPASLFWL
jgi:hypothetical protein